MNSTIKMQNNERIEGYTQRTHEKVSCVHGLEKSMLLSISQSAIYRHL